MLSLDQQDLPNNLSQVWQRYQTALDSVLPQKYSRLMNKAEYTKTCMSVCVSSDFIANLHVRYPSMVARLFITGEMLDRQYLSRYPACLQRLLTKVQDYDQLKQRLRQYRCKAMFRIAWRDLAGWADLADTIADLSAFADACIRESLIAIQRLESLSESDFIVIAMGKLGASELNFSSDIDLIFAYDQRTVSDESARLLARRLIDVLHTQTDEGFVFRVDMRLRPFGESGALVTTVPGLLQYYRQHGRDWERYAWIKARCVTGSKVLCEKLMAGMVPFIYRPYIDFAMQSAIRDMKQLVEIEVRKKNMHDHVKLGPGGIREIEFIVQALQLIHGGKYPALQTASIYSAMNILSDYQFLSEKVIADLARCYDFLRQVEHKLQMMQDKQTHLLPANQQDQAKLAYALNFPNWQACLAQLNVVRQIVSDHFSGILLVDSLKKTPSRSAASAQVRRQSILRRHRLRNNGIKLPRQFQDNVTAVALLSKLKSKGLQQLACERIEALLPVLLSVAQKMPAQQIEQAEKLVFVLVETIAFRSTYVSLLQERQEALPGLLSLMLKSQWIRQLILRYPMLLADITQDQEWQFPSIDCVDNALHRFVDGVDLGDIERQMEVMRYFKLSMLLLIAANEVGQMHASQIVGQILAYVAERIIAHVEKLAWRVLTQMHGKPEALFGDEHGFLIVGYGKLGGRELAYGSDLDIVFLYQGKSNHILGQRRLDIHSFYAKLAQKVVHLLRTQTYSGALYEVDLRLRPSGNSGLLVSSIEAFSQYQVSSAWTWEHQALVRARPLVGDALLVRRFEEIRRQVLCQQRDHQALKKQICDMQIRLREQHQHQDTFRNRIRYMQGGLIDLEFLVQYWVLYYASTCPKLVKFYGTIDHLHTCQSEQLVPELICVQLVEIYNYYNDLLRLDWLLAEELPAERLSEHSQYVISLWQQYLY